MFPSRLVGIFLLVTAGIVSPTATSGLDSPRAADLNFKGVALLSLTPTGETKLDFGSLDGSTWRSAGTHKSVQVDIQSTIPIGPKGFFGEVSQRDRSGFLAGLLPVRLIGEAREDACSQDGACDTVEFEVVLDSARVSRQTDTLVEVALGASYRTFRRVRFHKGVRSVGPSSTLSHHLDKLKAEDLVHVQRESTFLRYTANAESLQELLQFLYAECCTRNKAIKPERIIQICK